MKRNIDYGAELKDLLVKKGITQVELAEELGKTKDTVFKALHGGTMTPKNYDRYLQAIAILAERKRNAILEDALRQNIETSQKALEKIEKLKG